MRARRLLALTLVAVLGIGAVHSTVAAPPNRPVPMEALWQAPADLTRADLFNGPWDAEHAPDPDASYVFLRPKTTGANPGVTVVDARGRTWYVKQPGPGARGDEGPVEVVLSRVLSAIGYHQPPVYYLPSFMMTDTTGTHREPGGRFRIDHPSVRDRGSWSWSRNPFLGTRPLQGLLVILQVFNSWDLKDSNNSLYEVDRGNRTDRWYVVRDLGGALGESGRISAARNNIDLFERHRFITDVEDGFVTFAYRGWRSDLFRGRITVEDVGWALALLGRLSEEQWHDAFRAGGYQRAIAERFIQKIRANILAGQRWAGGDAVRLRASGASAGQVDEKRR
jgi:hypothetical protein